MLHKGMFRAPLVLIRSKEKNPGAVNDEKWDLKNYGKRLELFIQKGSFSFILPLK